MCLGSHPRRPRGSPYPLNLVSTVLSSQVSSPLDDTNQSSRKGSMTTPGWLSGSKRTLEFDSTHPGRSFIVSRGSSSRPSLVLGL